MTRVVVLPEQLQVVVDGMDEITKALKKAQTYVEDPILGTDDVMRLLKVSKRCLQTWRDEALIGFSAVGNKFYYRLSDIYKMLDNHFKKPGGEHEGL